MNITEFTDKLYSLEKELNLFEHQIMGVYFWRLIRFRLYLDLAAKIEILQEPIPIRNLSLEDQKKEDEIKTYNANNHSYITRKNEVDILVIDFPRKIKLKNKYIDIFTFFKERQLKCESISYEIVERPYLNIHYNKPTSTRSYFEDYSDQYKDLRKKFTFNFTNIDIQLIKNIEAKINYIFQIDFKITTRIKSNIRGFIIRKYLIKQALITRKIKKVYLVDSSNLLVIVAACKELNIECIEIQHGSIDYFHINYNFPYNESIPYFPDKFEFFGEYWINQVKMPIPLDNCLVTGYPYLRAQIDKYSNTKKNNKQVMFASQKTIGKQLSEYAYKIAYNNPEYDIVYKLHPSEFNNWEDYELLNKAIKLPNFKIFQDEKNLYELLHSSKYLFGVYSTVIYEALEVGCRVFIVDIDKMDFKNTLLDKNFVARINKEIVCMKTISSIKITPPPKNYFFA